MNNLAIYGAGGLGMETLMLISELNDSKRHWNPIGFFDDGQFQTGQKIMNFPFLGGMRQLNDWGVNWQSYSRLGTLQSVKVWLRN